MGLKKLDNRIRNLIENGVALGHRSMFVIVGNKGRDQVEKLHHILSKTKVAARPSILWCYKKELGFSSHRKKRIKEIKKKSAGGAMNLRQDDPFEIFISTTQIRYCYYAESQKILGNTFGMLVLQDFEAITPNLLARTIETVEGGGLVVLLLQSVNSLKQLYTMTMDVHNRYRTESHSEIVARFNERFILSLASCKACIVMDDQLNILPISSHIAKIEAVSTELKKNISTKMEELEKLQNSMIDTKPLGPLLKRCKTADQGKALLRLLDVITEKSLKATCSITAARGRGKSAAMGLAVAGAIGFGYTNIFVTSPSPENLNTFFEFIIKGFEAMELQEHTDYEVVQSTDQEHNKAVIRINVFRDHRQTIQYISPTDSSKLGQAELVVIDEAAAIPLPYVKDLISGTYLVFLASTINGYEGTGRSLSLKLLQQLREQAAGVVKNDKGDQKMSVRKLHELTLEESIRYQPGDPIELWLNKVLCLDATNVYHMVLGTPPPKKCELYYVNRDTLFSFHKSSETFLTNLMSIYVSAHYRNTPNDLQMLSDAPAHHLFVLMGPVEDTQTKLPEILAVIQVGLEGNLSKKNVIDSLSRGKRGSGDMLPWTISQQFLDNDFPTLSGARVIRIAVHPDFQSMGYGSRALQLLQQYYQGEIPLEKKDDFVKRNAVKTVDDESISLLDEQIEPRSNMPSLLMRLNERQHEELDYLGVSFGLTLNLLKFWKKAGYIPMYLRQTTNDLTGEHTCIMLKMLENKSTNRMVLDSSTRWIDAYYAEFRKRFISLLGFEFAKFPPHTALSILHMKNIALSNEKSTLKNRKTLTRDELALFLSNTDLKRLSQYARNMVDHHLITDLLPTVANLYFNDKLDSNVQINLIQSAILIGIGLQHKTVDQLIKELDMPANQILALFSKGIRKLSDYFDHLCMSAIEEKAATTTSIADVDMEPTARSLDEDLREAEQEIKSRQKRDKEKLMKELGKYSKDFAIKGTEDDWSHALDEVNLQTAKKAGGIISVKSNRQERLSNVDDDIAKLEPKKKKKKRKHE